MGIYNEKIAVALARDVYRREDRPPLPDGWSIYYNCPIEYQKDGYFGCAYQYKYVDEEGHNEVINCNSTQRYRQL